MIKNLDDAIA